MVQVFVLTATRMSRTWPTMWKTSIYPTLPLALCVAKCLILWTKWEYIRAPITRTRMFLIHPTSCQHISSVFWKLCIPGEFPNGPGMCPYCNQNYQNLAYHVEDKHCPNPTPCPLCGKIFNSLNKMRKHKSSYHKKDKTVVSQGYF